MAKDTKFFLQTVFLISQSAIFLKWFGFGEISLISGFNTLFINNWPCLIGIILFEYGLLSKPENILWRISGHVVIVSSAIYSMFTWYLTFVTPDFELWLGLKTVQSGFIVYLLLTMISLLINITARKFK